MALTFAHPQCNAAAYRLLSVWTEELPPRFPTVQRINRFEGLRGPDLAWWRGRTDSHDAYHYYNPASGEGQAPGRSAWHLRRFIAALQANPKDDAPIGYHAAWCAHFAVDALSPAHHVGHYHNPGSVKDNWRDPFGDDFFLWSPRNHHVRFEWAAWRTTRPGIALPDCRPQPFKPTETERQLRARADQVYRHRLFDRFIEHGWSPAVERTFREQVWPLTVRTVAALWWMALTTGQRP